jgi:acetyltransferase-like isoleucine patch superfamily enzyme
MASYQYVYVMKGLSKTYPGGKKVLDNIYLSFFPGAKIGVRTFIGAGARVAGESLIGDDESVGDGERIATDRRGLRLAA